MNVAWQRTYEHKKGSLKVTNTTVYSVFLPICSSPPNVFLRLYKVEERLEREREEGRKEEEEKSRALEQELVSLGREVERERGRWEEEVRELQGRLEAGGREGCLGKGCGEERGVLQVKICQSAS